MVFSMPEGSKNGETKNQEYAFLWKIFLSKSESNQFLCFLNPDEIGVLFQFASVYLCD